MLSLPLLMRLESRPVILLGEGYAADAKARLLVRAGAVIVGEEAEAALAIVAILEPDEAARAAARLKARGMLVNVVDRLDLCDFTLPAIVERGPVVVAIGTGGVSAGLAAALRQRLETLLPQGLGRVAQALHDARGWLREHFPVLDDRRRAIAGLLAPGGPLDPLADHDDPAATITQARAAVDRIERVAITSPDPDELTLRAARLLGIADRLYHAPDMPAAILDRARADAVRIVGPAPALAPEGLSLELVWMAR